MLDFGLTLGVGSIHFCPFLNTEKFNKGLKVPSFNVFSEGLSPVTEKIKGNPPSTEAGDILI